MLLGAVAALGALALVATTLATTAAVDRRRTADALESLQADALARSAVVTAAVLLGEQAKLDEPDTARSAWARPVARQQIGPGWVEVTVEDEARRLDLNAPGVEVPLGRLLHRLGLDQGVADALADWTDRDDVERPHGAERDWYRRHVPPLVPPNGPLGSVGELALAPRLPTRAPSSACARSSRSPASRGSTRTPRRPRCSRPGSTTRSAPATSSRSARRASSPATTFPAAPRAAQHYLVRATVGVGRVRRRVEAIVWPSGSDPRVTGWRQLEP